MRRHSTIAKVILIDTKNFRIDHAGFTSALSGTLLGPDNLPEATGSVYAGATSIDSFAGHFTSFLMAYFSSSQFRTLSKLI